MSLILSMMEAFVIMDKVREDDPEGGFITVWKEGASIQAIATLDTSMQARIAEQQGVTSVYTITVDKSVNLEYHDVVKRVSDGKVFRITSDGSDNVTPVTSGLDIRQLTAEKWELTK